MTNLNCMPMISAEFDTNSKQVAGGYRHEWIYIKRRDSL